MANEFIPRNKGVVIADAVTLFLPNGRVFEGWENMQIPKSLESISNAFSFRFDDRFDETQENYPFKPGDLVRVNIGDERVVTGRIDNMSISFSAESRTINVSGRSLCGDLIDCTVAAPFTVENKNVVGIAKDLVAPFGLEVLSSVESKIIGEFALKPGETVFTAIDRAARLQGFFWVSTRAGNIRLTKISRARASSELRQDVNLKSGAISFNESERFSQYEVIGNMKGTDSFSGLSASEPAAFAKDQGIERYRPLTLIAEASINTDQAQDRAQWEASVRLAKGMTLNCKVQGWRQEDGILWGVNQLTRVRSRYLGIDRDFLIANIAHTKNNSEGTVTNITLRREDAYQPKPVIPKTSDPKFDLGPGFK